MCKEDLGYLAATLFVLWPWGALVIDGVWWFFSGHTSGVVPWSDVRVFLALLWPFFWGGFIATLH